MRKTMFTYIIIGIISIIGIGVLVSCKKNTNKETAEKTAEQNPYMQMRKMALDVTAEQLGFKIPEDSIKVYGIVTDLDMDGGTATIVTYFSNL